MSDHVDQVSQETMAEMRAHLKEYDWAETEESGEDVGDFIDAKTDEEVLHHIETRYSGSIQGFKRDLGLV
jgi:delta 1-pyrroline-5-carboxylate dehydrogenase